jgi:DnaJ-class molecular chaperone
MTDPYEVMELEPGSSEAEVRRRYLELVRKHPPDRDPARFTEIRRAYDQLRDPEVRLTSQLFDVKTEDSLEAIVAEVERRLRTVRIPLTTLLSMAEQR